MNAIASMFLIATLAAALALAAQWSRQVDEEEAIQRTGEGFISLVEGLYAYRTDQVVDWPTSMTPLAPYMPNLQIDSGNANLGGANGEGGRYALNLTGTTLTLSTDVSTQRHADEVARQFGSRGASAATTGGWRITVNVPDPGGITLMSSTLLTDGTNRMQRSLWLQNTVSAGTSCSGNGIGMSAAGQLMRCVNDAWRTN